MASPAAPTKHRPREEELDLQGPAEAPPAPAEAAASSAAHARDPDAPAARDDAASRRTLSKTALIPEWLLQLVPFPEEESLVLTHVQHRDSTLPHFQCRLPTGESYGGKKLVANNFPVEFLCVGSITKM